jgi:hypothetical protein
MLIVFIGFFNFLGVGVSLSALALFILKQEFEGEWEGWSPAQFTDRYGSFSDKKKTDPPLDRIVIEYETVHDPIQSETD